jgi:hypothetical protein
MGLFIGFIVALFTEMYGLPLTIYFLSQWLGTSYPVLNPFSHNNGHLWLVLLGLSNSAAAMTVLHLVSNGLIFFGFYLLYAGWSLIYKMHKGSDADSPAGYTQRHSLETSRAKVLVRFPGSS